MGRRRKDGARRLDYADNFNPFTASEQGLSAEVGIIQRSA
jgi:hypothetical protein